MVAGAGGVTGGVVVVGGDTSGGGTGGGSLDGAIMRLQILSFVLYQQTAPFSSLLHLIR